jgi:hypothetical protein
MPPMGVYQDACCINSIKLTKVRNIMTTFVNVFKSIATPNQIAQVSKAMHSESLIETLRELHKEELLAIKGIGPKLAEVLLEAATEYRRLIAEYPVDLIDDIQEEEEEYLAPELDNALQSALMNIKPRMGQIFTVPEESVKTVPNSVPGGTEEAMAGLTKALRGCIKQEVLTKECVLMIEGNLYRVHQGPWTDDFKKASHSTDLVSIRARLRAMYQGGYAGTVSLYVVKCVDGVITERAPKPWFIFNCATRKTMKQSSRTPAFGIVTITGR